SQTAVNWPASVTSSNTVFTDSAPKSCPTCPGPVPPPSGTGKSLIRRGLRGSSCLFSRFLKKNSTRVLQVPQKHLVPPIPQLHHRITKSHVCQHISCVIHVFRERRLPRLHPLQWLMS